MNVCESTISRDEATGLNKLQVGSPQLAYSFVCTIAAHQSFGS